MIDVTHDGRADPRAAVVAALVSAALAVLWTWPLAAHLSSRIPHDPGDPILNTWILWWNAHAVPFTSGWWDPPMFYPMRGALALSEHLAGISALATPMQAAGARPLVAYNVSLLLSFALSALFAFLLVSRLTGSVAAGACAGLAFGFAPYRAGQLAHLQVLTSQWMPLMFLGLHGYLADGRRIWLIVFGGAWLLQALANGYYLLFLPVLVAAWLAWFVPWRTRPRVGLTLVAVWTLASLPLLPILGQYRTVQTTLHLSRSAEDIRRFSATMASFAHPAPLLAWWPPGAGRNPEDYLFTGLTAPLVVLLALSALAYRRRLSDAAWKRSLFLFYGLAALLMAALAFGPGPDRISSLLRPYWWLSKLPGYDGLRAPARFAMPFAFCLSVAAGLVVARLRTLGARTHLIAVVVIVLGLTIDGMTERLPIAAPPPRVDLPDVRAAIVIELPPDDPRVSLAAMYRAIYHGRPLVNGYSGYEPPHYTILWQALRRGDTTPLLWLARDRPLLLIVNERTDPAGDFRAMVEALPRIQEVGTGNAGTMWLLPVQPVPRSNVSGDRLRATAHDTGREQLVVDAGGRAPISAVTFPLRRRYEELAPRIRIEASDDGLQWQEVWLGWTGGLAMAATLEDPRNAFIRIPLPSTTARYLRIYPAPPWLRDEISILGVR